jgi:recombination associated protein RdgC
LPYEGLSVFKNVMVFRLELPAAVDAAQVESALQSSRFEPCGASQEKALGWIEPRGVAHGPLLEIVGGQWILRLQTEVKIVPASVVKRRAQEQMKQIEASTGRKPGRKEAREIMVDVRLALLPMAFTKQAAVDVWIDWSSGFLVLDCGSQARADEVITCLVKAIDGFALRAIQTQMSPAIAMSQWLASKEPPAGFSVDRECELKASDESKAVVRYARHALDTDEITQHIASGKMPTRLAMTWGDRVSFVLTEALQLKKLAILDVVFEAASALASDRKDDNFDGDVAIATGELSRRSEANCPCKLRRVLPDPLESGAATRRSGHFAALKIADGSH